MDKVRTSPAAPPNAVSPGSEKKKARWRWPKVTVHEPVGDVTAGCRLVKQDSPLWPQTGANAPSRLDLLVPFFHHLIFALCVKQQSMNAQIDGTFKYPPVCKDLEECYDRW